MIHEGPWGDMGTLVQINVEEGDSKNTIKRKIGAVTNLHPNDIKVQFVSAVQFGASSKSMCSKSGVSHGNCGITEGVGLTAAAADEGIKPHKPRATPCLIDNSGNYDIPDM
jgi:hypothetical protein